ncbi:hypothetical protein SDC9_148280 [bioreactor metagenome]|uniref:Uncharacterized protein n=1 Tax=bioreactor metagenome TaxID=1076179 RepID=A0A645EIC9_9ZZZZ
MCHPINFILKAFNVLSFFHELIFRDKQGEESLLVSAVIENFPYDAVSVSPYSKTEGVPDVKSLYRVADVHNFCHPQEFVIPVAEFLFWRECCFFFAFCHTFTVLS